MTVSGKDGRLPLIDPLRAVAALSIFAYHALFVTGHLTPTDYGWYLNVGVPLFYGISGLVLFLPYARALGSGRSLPDARRYARHRMLRIVPAYWVALPIVAWLLLRGAQVFSAGGVITYFGFLQMYRLETFTGGIGQAWTLCVEIAFYIFLPIFAATLLIAVRKWRELAGPGVVELAAIGTLAVVSVLWKVLVILHFGNDIRGLLVPLTVLPAALDQFAVGMAVAVIVVRRQGAGRKSPPWLPTICLLGSAIAFLAIGWIQGLGPFDAGEIGLPTGWSSLAEHELKAVVAAGLIVAAITAIPGSGIVGRLLGSRLLRWLGTVSYGFYLWHLAMLTVLIGGVAWVGGKSGVLDRVGQPIGVLVALIASIGAAALSWYLLERRMIAIAHSGPENERN